MTRAPVVTEAEVGNGEVIKVVWVTKEELQAIHGWIAERLAIEWDKVGPLSGHHAMAGPFA